MPITNTLGSYSIGRDTQVVVMHPLAPGGRLDLPGVTDFDVKPVYDQIKSKRLDGNVIEAAVPAGYTVTFNVDRAGPALNDLQALIDAAFHVGGTVYGATVFQYVQEPNGSTSVYQFTDCSFQVTDLGHNTPDAVVKQSVNMTANRMVRV